MRYDRMPHCPPVEVVGPDGDVSEMEVALTLGEIGRWCAAEGRTVPPGWIVEPWVRVTEGADWTLAAGVEITDGDSA